MKETGNVADCGGKYHAHMVTRTESAGSASTSGRQQEDKGDSLVKKLWAKWKENRHSK
jgi:hypothetical protein